ncbi:type IV toxin-antitoxin system AbiEi family antitoxin domain-containing protein [Nocardia sp. NPDC058640]|uniref:type IV toxin-antitoxin system AbiEi family antitoxin domain-containing protein n=1 Tax=Nocardia sp. NPDC058640 TaxID=3346571 RepID=UPI00364E7984
MNSATNLRARLAELAESQWGLLTTAQAATVGVNGKQLQRLVDHAVLERLRHGVYRMAGVPDHPVEPMRAEWLALEPARPAGERIRDDVPSGVVSHRSAADLHGLGDLDADYFEFSVPTRCGTRSPDVRFHRAVLAPNDWTLVDGLPVTTPVRTIRDLAAARTDGGHLASVVRDALIQGASADEIVKALRNYAPNYAMSVDHASALLNHFITQAGIPESALVLAAPALEPLLAAGNAWTQALDQLVGGQRSAHLATTLASPTATGAAMQGTPSPRVRLSSMKVEQAVRERVGRLARAEGRTVSQTIAHLLDEHDRRHRFAAVSAGYAEVDPEYAAEVGAWDVTLEDGLDEAR